MFKFNYIWSLYTLYFFFCAAFVWSQEEHRNMGAWTFVRPRFENLIGQQVKTVPATGTATATAIARKPDTFPLFPLNSSTTAVAAKHPPRQPESEKCINGKLMRLLLPHLNFSAPPPPQPVHIRVSQSTFSSIKLPKYVKNRKQH